MFLPTVPASFPASRSRPAPCESPLEITVDRSSSVSKAPRTLWTDVAMPCSVFLTSCRTLPLVLFLSLLFPCASLYHVSTHLGGTATAVSFRFCPAFLSGDSVLLICAAAASIFTSRTDARLSTRWSTSSDNSTCMASSCDTHVETIPRRRFTSDPKDASAEATLAPAASACAVASARSSEAMASILRKAASTRPSGISAAAPGGKPAPCAGQRLFISARSASASFCIDSHCWAMDRSTACCLVEKSAAMRSSDR
mmetsp:Transcript_59467/g.139199  ORF Transcript_59467/g.139199 Transcript_59467/m.139199 type:complete len:255 (-) Transcript_59467:3-767(-)